MNKVIMYCQICKGEIAKSHKVSYAKYEKRQFCSTRCSELSWYKNRPDEIKKCITCKEPIIPNTYKNKYFHYYHYGERKFCSKPCSDWYMRTTNRGFWKGVERTINVFEAIILLYGAFYIYDRA